MNIGKGYLLTNRDFDIDLIKINKCQYTSIKNYFLNYYPPKGSYLGIKYKVIGWYKIVHDVEINNNCYNLIIDGACDCMPAGIFKDIEKFIVPTFKNGTHFQCITKIQNKRSEK